jgi:ABC-type lipoprotein export system ATPase subunit
MAGDMSHTILEFQNVTKTFPQAGRQDLVILRDICLEVAEGSSLAIVGRSGSGKSTLLHLAAGIDSPSAGRVILDGRDLAGLSERNRTLLRRENIGLVFQFFHLLPHLSVRDNIALPAWIAGDLEKDLDTRIADLLIKVELIDRPHEAVQKLSGGEMQRVAICRALLRKPRLLLADEPTGSLDDENSRRVMDLLIRLAKHEGSTLIYVTHSMQLAYHADIVLRLHGGKLGVL